MVPSWRKTKKLAAEAYPFERIARTALVLVRQTVKMGAVTMCAAATGWAWNSDIASWIPRLPGGKRDR